MGDAAIKPIVISAGEPAGIGPDIVLMLSLHELPAVPLVIADMELLAMRADALGFKINFINNENSPKTHQPGVLCCRHIPTAINVTTGRLDRRNAAYVLSCIKTATDGCLRGEYSALVTAPVHKGIINDAGIAFSGHTEYLAELSGGYPVMLLAAKNLRVALVTTHLPLKDVSAAITEERLIKTIHVLHRDLKDRFHIANPRIAVTGLNPHAGEGGHLGDEEQKTIIPALDQLRQHGLNISGPLPADTVFTTRQLQNYDAVLTMYHDQGLPVLKHAGFGEAVNITLGLPIIRTSVDHGTALELAGTGKADPGSLIAAFKLAANLSKKI